MLVFPILNSCYKCKHVLFYFFFRLFKISDNIHEDVNSNDSTNLDYPIGSMKIAPTEMNKGEPWKCSSSKQKHQYSDINLFTASSTFSASEIREDIFKAPTFSLASQPHEVQGNSLLFQLIL